MANARPVSTFFAPDFAAAFTRLFGAHKCSFYNELSWLFRGSVKLKTGRRSTRFRVGASI
jgi:hypothetical protein